MKSNKWMFGLILALVLCLCASVAMAATTVVYNAAELQDAFNAGGTVKLGKNITLGNSDDGFKILAGKTVELDLNGHILSQTKTQTAGYQMILNDGNLTITDSVGTGKISYTDNGNGGEYISDTIYNRAKLVIEGGTIENLSSATVASNGYPHAVDTYSGLRDTSVTINGGTVYCKEYSAIRMFCVSATYKADLIINGGVIKGAVDMQNGTKTAANGSLEINGGTFETTKNANNIRFANWNGGANEYGITADINNGSFDGGISTVYVPATASFKTETFINGGSFADQTVIEQYAEPTVAASSTKVNFAANGGVGAMESVHVVGGTYTLPQNGFRAPSGKQFKAWNVNGVEMAAGADIALTAELTLSPIWENAPVAPSGSYSVPKTGDNTNIALLVSLVALSAAAFVVLSKKVRFN